jgi:hypothetical protein
LASARGRSLGRLLLCSFFLGGGGLFLCRGFLGGGLFLCRGFLGGGLFLCRGFLGGGLFAAVFLAVVFVFAAGASSIEGSGTPLSTDRLEERGLVFLA